jgi:ankyrin repeat protein
MATWEDYKKTMVEPSTLWAAAKANDVAELERLLAAGADIDARDHRGYSPLMLAAYAGHAEAFDLLLDRGADPCSADAAGNSVLMGAVFKGHRAMVERLLSAGADLRVKNHAGLDARAFATTFGRVDVAAFLETYAAEHPPV